MALTFVTSTVRGVSAAGRLLAALEELDPAPLACGIHDRDDGSGLWEVTGYFDAAPDRSRLHDVSVAEGGSEFRVSPVGTRDWVAQVREGLTPVVAGRFVVYGTHDRDQIPMNLVGLEIDAALAFGTGHHATTQGCLLAIDGLARRQVRVTNALDIGTGTGVLAMAVARLWPARIVASDTDPYAVATARTNAIANRLAPRIRITRADGLRSPLLRAHAPYDLVLANILANPLRRLAGLIACATASGGIVVLSGLLDRQAGGVFATYRSHGFIREQAVSLGGWTTLVLRRRCRQKSGSR